MKRFFTGAVAVACVGVALGCSGLPMGGGGYANKAACTKWVEAQNALPCMKMAPQDAATMCPDVLDDSPTDMTEYYGCMEKNAKCNGEIPDLMGQTACSPM
jgi:hypothetical protein